MRLAAQQAAVMAQRDKLDHAQASRSTRG